MSSSTPLELNATSIIGLIETGAYPHDILLNFARGFLPIEQGEVVAVIAYLCNSTDDDEIAANARQTLSDTPSRVVVAFAENENNSAANLDLLARATNDNFVLESLVRNKSFPDSSVAELAQRAEAHVQDIIVTNQSRIIRAPHILDALLENPRLSSDNRRRAMEVREEFFDKKARLQAAIAKFDLEASEEEAPMEAIADLLAAAEAEPQPQHPLPELPEQEKNEKTQSIWAQITQMTVGEKVLLAFRGDKTVRSILIRERNRLVCSSTMRNPRMTMTEVENISGMREVDQEVLRLISLRREWMAKYPVVLALARNPRTPVGVVLPLINRLTLRDLKGLKDDKGVAEVVRTTARKFYQARQKNA